MRHSLGQAVASPRRGIVGRLAPTLSDTTEQLRASFVLSRNVARLGLLLAPAYRRLSRAPVDRSQDRRPVRTAPRAGPAECREHRPERIQKRRTPRKQDRALDRVSRETRSKSLRVTFAVDVAVVSMTVSRPRRQVLQRVLLTISLDVRFAGDPGCLPSVGSLHPQTQFEDDSCTSIEGGNVDPP
jgi:hypothetical protein